MVERLHIRILSSADIYIYSRPVSIAVKGHGKNGALVFLKCYNNVEFEKNNNKFKFIVIIYGQGTYSLNWCSIAIVCREGI